MTPRWFCAKGKRKLGPLTPVELRRLAGSGTLLPDDMVLQEGTNRWARARSVAGLFPRRTLTVSVRRTGAWAVLARLVRPLAALPREARAAAKRAASARPSADLAWGLSACRPGGSSVTPRWAGSQWPSAWSWGCSEAGWRG